MESNDRGLELKMMIAERFKKMFHTPDGSISTENNFVVPDGYKVDVISMNGVKAEHLVPNEVKTDIVVLQFHGGGYMMSYNDMYRNTAIFLSEAAGGAEVYSIDYRIPPQFTYPFALIDAVASYKYLIEKGIDPNKIILEGDSAGGNLIFATALYLRDHKIPLPKLIIGWSPWTNMENDSPTRTKNLDLDILLGSEGIIPEKRELVYSQYSGEENLKDPYVSPCYGDYHGFTNVLIQVGTYEVLLDDSIILADKLKEAGVNVTLTQYEGMFHTFLNILPDLDESKQAWEEVRQKIKDVFY